MFQLHIAYSLALLVLAAGLVLIYFGMKQTSRLLKISGILLTVLTVGNIVCMTYYGVRYWKDGYFRSPYAQASMMTGKMGENAGMNCPMMKEMMQNMMQQNKTMNQKSGTISRGAAPDHAAHHQ